MTVMDVTIHIPDELATRLGTIGDLSRRALEALAIEELRSGRLTEAELRRLLGLTTRQALDVFLKEHGVYHSYTVDDLERDREDLQRLGF
jgi:predicted HTH domain antitoxin